VSGPTRPSLVANATWVTASRTAPSATSAATKITVPDMDCETCAEKLVKNRAAIVVGVRLEERDLRRTSGGTYEEYRRRVGMLIPRIGSRD
jgi:protein-S-isoprenylcysteine O-methyltransferase Ste14